MSTQSRAKSACRSSRKMSAAMSAMAAAPIRAASSRRAPRARTGAKVRAHPESPRRFILSLEGSRGPWQRTPWRRRVGRGDVRPRAAPGSHLDRGVIHVTLVSSSWPASTFDRSIVAVRARRRDPGGEPGRIAHRPSSSRRVGPSREDSRPDRRLLTPPLTPRVSIQTQASKRNLARPAVSDPSQVSVSAPPPTRRPRARRRFEGPILPPIRNQTPTHTQTPKRGSTEKKEEHAAGPARPPRSPPDDRGSTGNRALNNPRRP